MTPLRRSYVSVRCKNDSFWPIWSTHCGALYLTLESLDPVSPQRRRCAQVQPLAMYAGGWCDVYQCMCVVGSCAHGRDWLYLWAVVVVGKCKVVRDVVHVCEFYKSDGVESGFESG